MKQTNQQWIDRRNAAVARGVGNACTIYADRIAQAARLPSEPAAAAR